MEQFEITAEARELKGKGASRRLRHTGYIPAIVYGAGQEPVNIQLEHNDVIKHTEHEAFYSHILSLKLPTGTERVVLKDMQRHPYKALVLHMDFLRVNEKEKLTMRVPLHFINEETSLGVKSGGVVSHVITELEVLCFPRDLPEYIEVDVANMNLGDTLHLSDITVPSGVEIASLLHGGDDALPVVSIQLPKGGADDAAEASEQQADEDTDSTE
ncbi:MAG: large subunit ribosomal protein L25 [Gammaproteobacteria bacterium]|jgi:large subunit ribosomal protein L25